MDIEKLAETIAHTLGRVVAIGLLAVVLLAVAYVGFAIVFAIMGLFA